MAIQQPILFNQSQEESGLGADPQIAPKMRTFSDTFRWIGLNARKGTNDLYHAFAVQTYWYKSFAHVQMYWVHAFVLHLYLSFVPN